MTVSPLGADKGRQVTLERLSVSRETATQLDTYVGLLNRWQPIKNLVAPSTLEAIWPRHILDSGQLASLFPDAKVWVDFGSGAGFPDMVVAILLAGQPGRLVHLIESNQRKAAFLREVARVTGAPVLIHAGRIEAIVPTLLAPVDLVTARALASLADLLDLAAPLLKNGAQAAFLKGQDVEGELTEAAKSWRIKANLIPSLSDKAARIVHVSSAEKESVS